MLCAQLGVFPFDSERGAIARARANGEVALRFFAALRMTILTRFFAALRMTGKKVVGWNVESNAVGRGLAPAEAYKFSTVQSPLRRAERATSPIGRGLMKAKKNKKGGEQNCSSPMRRLFCFSIEGSLTAVFRFSIEGS